MKDIGANRYLYSALVPSPYMIAAITVDARENIYLTGSYSGKFFVSKLNAVGYILWTREVSGSSTVSGRSITVDDCGNLFMTGCMGTTLNLPAYTMDFPGYMLIAPPGSYDPMFLVRYDTSGNYISSTAFGSGGDDESVIIADKNGNFIMTGDILYSDVAFGSHILHGASGHEFLFLTKNQYLDKVCERDVSAVKDTIANIIAEVTVFPNPANERLTITAAKGFTVDATVNMYDARGFRAFSCPLKGTDTSIPLTDFPPGLYQMVIYDGNNIPVTRKVAIVR
jgi:hypothetical protein